MSEEKLKTQTVTVEAVDDTVSKVHKLQQRFYTVCGELFKYIEFIGEPMYNLMLEHYFAQYKREYELMNAAEFIEVDKQIEQMKIERDKEIEAVKLERDKQKLELQIQSDKLLEEIKLEREKLKKQLEMQREKELKEIDLERAKLTEELATVRDKELEEVKLEHSKLLAEIERKREKLNTEIEILAETSLLESQIKIDRIIPQTWRRFNIGRLHFGKVCQNEAMTYAEEAASIEINEYLAMRAKSVSENAGEEGEPAPEAEQEPQGMTKREYNKWLKHFEKQQRKRKAEAQAQADKIMREESDGGAQAMPKQEANATACSTETPMEGEKTGAAASVSLIAENVEGD